MVWIFFVFFVWICFNCFFVIFNCLVFMQARGPGARRVGARTKGWGPEGWGPEAEGWGPEGWGARRVGARGPKGGGPKGGGPKGGGPKGGARRVGGPKGGGPKGGGAQNFAFFFSPATKFVLSFLPSLVVFSWNFGGVWSPGRSNVHVWSSRIVMWSPGGLEAAGVSHDNQRAQTCTFEGPGLQKHHQNSTRRHPEKEEKNEFCGGRGKKKERNVGRSGKGGPGKGGPDTTQHTTNQSRFGQSRFWPKSVLAKVGFGQSRFWPKLVLAKVGHDRRTSLKCTHLALGKTNSTR